MAYTIGQFEKLLKKALLDSLSETSDVIVDAIKKETPVNTGILRDSIVKVEDGDTFNIIIDTQSPAKEYAEYVNYGTSRMQGRYFFEVGYSKADSVKTFKNKLKSKL